MYVHVLEYRFWIILQKEHPVTIRPIVKQVKAVACYILCARKYIHVPVVVSDTYRPTTNTSVKLRDRPPAHPNLALCSAGRTDTNCVD